MAGNHSSSARETSPKPWKQKIKKKTPKGTGLPQEIEIFEGKPAVTGPSFLESTPADDKGYLRILCKEEVEFLVPAKVVEQLNCMDVILHGEVQFKEKLENVIRFPDFRAEVLESVMRFVFIEYLDSLKAEQYWGQNAPRVTFQFEVEPGQVMELVYAAHFFGIGNLVNVAAAMIAHHLKDVPDVSSMPPDLAWCVAEQFAAQDLFDAEERADFLSLSLDTSSLWEKHCKKLLQDDTITPVILPDNYPQYDKWAVSEGPPPTSWKSLYNSVYLQQLADRQDGSSNKALLEEIAYKGKWAYTHTIRSTFWDWVMTGQGGLSFNLYAAQFPNLFSLYLAKVPLRYHLDNGSLLVGQILQATPLLQLLDISETGFTKEAAICLSKALQFHNRLQVLRLAYNCIATEGYAAIARTLPFARSLKILDVRENEIGSLMPEDAVAAIQASSLEELLLDGNCRYVEGVNDDVVSSSESMSRLDISLNTNRAPAVRAVCTAVPASLKSLQLQQCDFSDDYVTILAQALKNHVAIQKIDLSDNKITSEGASAILLWLQENSSLLELYLANNNITDSCSVGLCTALRSHSSLEKFCLRGNYSYGEENLPEVIHAALERGDALLASKQRKFTLDLRCTDVSYSNRARIQRQAANFASLNLLI